MTTHPKQCTICLEHLSGDVLSTDALLHLVMREEERRRRCLENDRRSNGNVTLMSPASLPHPMTPPPCLSGIGSSMSSASSDEYDGADEEDQEQSNGNKGGECAPSDSHVPPLPPLNEGRTTGYRAVGVGPKCREQHFLCTPCVVDFLLDATNKSCPLCREPLDAAVQMCHAWVVERERADYMCAQQDKVRETTEQLMETLRDQYVDDVERAALSALQHVRYRLFPESEQNKYAVEVQRHTEHVEWRYKSDQSNVYRHCHVPIDRKQYDHPLHDEHGFAQVPPPTDPISVTLTHRDWHRLCLDLFGIRLAHVSPPVRQCVAGRKRKRRLCSDRADSEYTAPSGDDGLERQAYNEVMEAAHRFGDRCDELIEQMRYNTRSPCRNEMLCIMRRQERPIVTQ